uniref:CSON010192 protein n=1 Tax=Culicoides sonorensis TaxID=179676 RepID=A0A336K6A2_CULSO
MVQKINLIVLVQGENTFQTQILTKKEINDFCLSDTNKICGKNGIDLISSCENCDHSIQLNIFWQEDKKTQNDTKNIVQIKQCDESDNEDFDDDNLMSGWDEPEISIKEEPVEHIEEKPVSEIPLEQDLIHYPGLPYPLPANLVLPPLENIRAPFYDKFPQEDGTIVYIERRRSKIPVRVANYDLRSTTCDICNYEVSRIERMTGHRKFHFFNKLSEIKCHGCGVDTNDWTADDRVNHTFFCIGKNKINGLVCTLCDYAANSYKTLCKHFDKHRLTKHAKARRSEEMKNEIERTRIKRIKPVDRRAFAIDEYLKYLSLPKNYTLPNLYTLNAQHSKMHLQPDGSYIYVGKGSNHLQVMNFDPRCEKCDLCGKSQLKSKSDLITHRCKDHFFPEFAGNECQGCHQEFFDPEAKMAHSHFCDQKSTIRVNFCSKCNEQFPAYQKYASHLKTIHDGDGIDLKYMCHLCSSTFERSNQLELHVLKHIDPKPYKCAHCDAEFRGRHGLETHLIRTHFPHEARQICNVCNPPVLFGSSEQYRTHLNVVHFNKTKEKEECPQCKKMIRKQGLAHHIRQQHTNICRKEKYECPTCNKIFFNKKGLEIHTVIHLPEDQKLFRCRFCGRSFNYKQHLLAHERSHTGEKPFKCDHEGCGKAFARKQALTDHQREHNGQGYECSVCKRMFTDRGNYRHHMKQHESQLGIKLTFNHEERRLMRLKVLTAEQALKGGLNDDFLN